MREAVLDIKRFKSCLREAVLEADYQRPNFVGKITLVSRIHHIIIVNGRI